MRYYLVAVIGTPALLWAVCLGCGLALERVLRVRLGNGLLLALGLCVAYVLIMPGYTLGAGDALAVALLAAVALAGLVFAQGGLRARLNPGWPGVAGVAAYVLYMLPVIAYGHWTWSGYGFVNDSAFELILANHVKEFGTVLGSLPESSERQFLVQYLGSGYPLGTQSLLGTLSGMIETPVEILYQGYIAGLAALAAVALGCVAGRWLRGWRGALVAFGAIAANLTYQYALQGGIKEIGLLAALCAAVALADAAIALGRPYAGGALVAVAVAAALATYNAVALPYMGVLVLLLGGGVVLVHRVWPGPRWILPLAAGCALAAVLAIPSLKTFETFFNVAQAGQGATGVGAGQTGQLLRKLPFSEISGVWLYGEYRLPVPAGLKGAATALASVAIFVLLVPGVLWGLRRRRVGALLLLGVVAVVMLVVYPRVSPYAQGKLLAIGSPAVVFVALAFLAGLRGRFSPAALVLGGALLLGILASDALAYSHDRVAPTERIEAARAVGEHFAGEGLVLWNEFEEYAKYFARSARISAPFEAVTPQQVVLRAPTYFYGHYFDLDEETLPFVESDPIVVTRRSPTVSRPPANFELAYENRFYLGWRRTTAPQVLQHLSEQQLYSSTATVTCPALKTIVTGAPRGTELIVASAPEAAWFEPQSDSRRAPGWIPDPTQPGAVSTLIAGQAEGRLAVRGGARYAVWVQGDFPRKVYVEVDGHTVGWVAGTNTPGQWLQAASVYLSAGRHRVRLVSTAGHLHHLGPGEWAVGTIGAAALVREEAETMRAVALAKWRSLCGKPADWVELVRP
ncbi:MAG TPA: hypothetical protein VK756_08785 [Solirubrobacteraceae bacterium]|nr:hypothetical protein [Solirubrobacteraceae bacterium]